jgi:hypothetical protein
MNIAVDSAMATTREEGREEVKLAAVSAVRDWWER